MNLNFSFIIPVYNRPQEIEELLYSFTQLNYEGNYEIVIVEDGSTISSEKVVEVYSEKLPLTYHYIDNVGAGKARNFGMQNAKGNYFIVLDSDTLIPPHYLNFVAYTLGKNYTDAFGGPDAAHASFTDLQKAINYSMTSVITTGGIRGKKKSVGKFQPRSFNFGMSKKAFELTGGFSEMEVGEDIDLTFRIWEQGLESQLIPDAFVYHKRRTDLEAFFKQTFKFGTARPVLNKKFPTTKKMTYWFPSLFVLGFALASLGFMFGFWQLIIAYYLYFTLLLLHSLLENKNVKVAFLSIVTTLIQFTGYGVGFLKSQFRN